MTKKSRNLKALYVVFLFLIIGTVYKTGFATFWNKGKSMAPTINDGQYLVVNKVFYNYTPIERYDIIVIRNGSENLIKRIIAMPNEVIKIKAGKIFVNGKPLIDDPKEHAKIDARVFYGPKKIPYGCYFYMGDNREISSYGIVKEEDVRGKVILN
tara:strand:- start:251 stop:715 length:465 start_codon:yes stop_codon:yes gene_type:complete